MKTKLLPLLLVTAILFVDFHTRLTTPPHKKELSPDNSSFYGRFVMIIE